MSLQKLLTHGLISITKDGKLVVNCSTIRVTNATYNGKVVRMVDKRITIILPKNLHNTAPENLCEQPFNLVIEIDPMRSHNQEVKAQAEVTSAFKCATVPRPPLRENSSVSVYNAFGSRLVTSPVPMFGGGDGDGDSSKNWGDDAEEAQYLEQQRLKAKAEAEEAQCLKDLAEIDRTDQQRREAQCQAELAEAQQPPPSVPIYVKNKIRGPLDAIVAQAKSHDIYLDVVQSGPVFLLDVSLLLANGILTIGVSARGNEVVCGVMMANGAFKYGCISNVDPISYPALLAMFPEKAETLDQVVQSRRLNKVVKPYPHAGLLPVPSCPQYYPCQAISAFPVSIPCNLVFDEWGQFVGWRVVPLA